MLDALSPSRQITTTASVPVDPRLSRAARSSTKYPSASAASITFRRVASAIAGLPDSARLTVGWLTPARSATSKDVGRLRDPTLMASVSTAC
jgi:hypothetical protein